MKLIYESMEAKTNYSQVYILLVILLLLSQDDMNNEAIQKIVKCASQNKYETFYSQNSVDGS